MYRMVTDQPDCVPPRRARKPDIVATIMAYEALRISWTRLIGVLSNSGFELCYLIVPGMLSTFAHVKFDILFDQILYKRVVLEIVYSDLFDLSVYVTKRPRSMPEPGFKTLYKMRGIRKTHSK